MGHFVQSIFTNYISFHRSTKKSLKIPKGQPETINHRTETAMAKRKKTKK